MTTALLYAAESWEKVYKAFEEINFTAYDYSTVKQSLIDSLKLKYSETYNDYIESSEMIALIELFAYVAEQHAYRADMLTHENLLDDASRKQSILKLVRLVSYTASRNMPLRGLVKLDSISCSESVIDSQGNNLSNKPIRWADATNPLWREQFFAVLNKIMPRPVGDPLKAFQVDSTYFQLYELSNLTEDEADGTSFVNGTLRSQVEINGRSLPFEIVPADIDDAGVFERSPNPKGFFSLLLTDDGYGDTSPMTGVHMFLKQGTLNRLQYSFDYKLPNRALDINVPRINDTDVWLQQIDAANNIQLEWTEVPNVNGENLSFNTMAGTKKYEIETLEDDKIRIIFGAGDFSDIPLGAFQLWVRSSESGGLTLPKDKISQQTVTFAYNSHRGVRESCTLVYSLVAPLQNASVSEDIEHIRSVAPGVHQAQNRMVSGEDYNEFPLQDPSIIHLRTVNRTFAGQPKYLEWNDASGAYQNVKLFGSDGLMYYDIVSQATTTRVSSRALIDEVIEPLLSNPGVYNLLAYSFFTSGAPLNVASVRPRTKFIENADLLVNGTPMLEKTLIQGALDRHWYGEPSTLVHLGPDLTVNTSPKTYYGLVDSDSDKRVYDSTLKLVTTGTSGYDLVPTPGNMSGVQDFVARQRKFGIKFNPERLFASTLVINPPDAVTITAPSNLSASNVTQGIQDETFTIELIDTSGAFTVFGSKTGQHPDGMIGVPYDNGLISFVIDYPTGGFESLVAGDAFIVTLSYVGAILTLSIQQRNLLGRFELIDESLLPDGAESLPFDITQPASSWVILVERIDDVDGKLLYWRVTNRSFDLTVYSESTKFWYNADGYLVDPETKLRTRDQFKLLKSNLLKNRSRAIGVDQPYFVVDRVLHANGEVNPHALRISPELAKSATAISSATGDVLAPFQFLSFIGSDEYVYFKKDVATGILTPVAKTVYIENLLYSNNESAEGYVRKLGRDALDFLWVHFVANDNVTDPTSTNINDMFVLTKGYWASMQDWLTGLTATEPTPPTPYELRATYRKLLSGKMISDTVVLHPAKLKLLFGQKAAPELRAKLKLIKAKGSKLTDEQLRVKTLEIVNQYFDIADWKLGREFYATELSAVVHAKLPIDVVSAVIVPEFPANTFGDMFYVRAAPDESLVSCMELADIVVTKGIDKVVLRQG